jgi:hypothetical protein
VTSGSSPAGPRNRHAGHRPGDLRRGPCSGGNPRTGACQNRCNDLPRPRPAGRCDADGRLTAGPGGHTARRHRARAQQSRVRHYRAGARRRGPGTSQNRRRPADASRTGAGRPAKAGQSTQGRPGRHGHIRNRRPAGGRHPRAARTFWSLRPGKPRSRHARNPGRRSRPARRGNRQSRRDTTPGKPTYGPRRQAASPQGVRAGTVRRGPARCRHCHDRSRPLCSSLTPADYAVPTAGQHNMHQGPLPAR